MRMSKKNRSEITKVFEYKVEELEDRLEMGGWFGGDGGDGGNACCSNSSCNCCCNNPACDCNGDGGNGGAGGDGGVIINPK